MLFADDVLLFKPICVPRDVKDFQEDIDKLFNWTKQNHLQINIRKTKTIVISRKCPQNFIPCVLYVDNNPISIVKIYKYLGIVISNDLSWFAHIETISCKAWWLLGFIYCTFLSRYNAATTIKLYKSQVVLSWTMHVLFGTLTSKKTRKHWSRFNFLLPEW